MSEQMTKTQKEGIIINTGIAEMVNNEATRLMFMEAMSSGSPLVIEKFYVDKFKAPTDLAQELSELSDQELWDYIGKRVCAALW